MTPSQARSRREKIDAIMTMAGVAPRDFDMCRGNYSGLTEPEIDKRFERLNAAHSRVEDWRAGWSPLDKVETPSIRYTMKAGPAEHPVKQQMGVAALEPDEFLQAYARVGNAISQLHPTAIVGLNTEGRTLVHSLMEELDFTPVVASVDASPAGRLTWNHITLPDAEPVVALVGHYLDSGVTMAAAAAQAKRIYGTPRVVCAVLAASEVGAETVSRDNKLIYHQIIIQGPQENVPSSLPKNFVPLSDIKAFTKKLPPHLAQRRGKLPTIRQMMQQRYHDDVD